MSINTLTHWSRLALSLGLSALLVLPVPLVAQAQQVQSFSGRATVVRATVLGITTVISDTGPLPGSGGSLEASLLDASAPGLVAARVAHASTVGQGNASSSEASVADLSLTAGGNTIAADFLMARATAACTNSGPTASGTSEIVGLMINGQGVTVSGQPNQTISLPDGRLIINEQHSSVDNKSADITVNPLHVVIDGVADVVISSAHADVACTGPPVCPGETS